MISDYLSHDKYAVHVSNKKIIEHFKDRSPAVNEVEIFSDGASQHFKQRFTLYSMTFLQDDIGIYKM